MAKVPVEKDTEKPRPPKEEHIKTDGSKDRGSLACDSSRDSCKSIGGSQTTAWVPQM